MQGKLVTLGIVLILSTLISGCGMPAGIEVETPDVDVKVDVDVPEVEVEVPGVKVGIDTHKVEVQVPMVGVDVDIAGVTIDLDAPDIGISAGATGTIRGSGNVIAEDRPVRNFDRISLIGIGEVNITQADEESLTVEADDNLMRYIRTEVRNGTLILGFTNAIRKKNIRPSEPIRFNLSVRELADLDSSGVGDVNVASLDTDRLEIVISGAVDVDVESLVAEKLVVDINGAGDVRLVGRVVDQQPLGGAVVSSEDVVRLYVVGGVGTTTELVELRFVHYATPYGFLKRQLKIRYYDAGRTATEIDKRVATGKNVERIVAVAAGHEVEFYLDEARVYPYQLIGVRP